MKVCETSIQLGASQMWECGSYPHTLELCVRIQTLPLQHSRNMKHIIQRYYAFILMAQMLHILGAQFRTGVFLHLHRVHSEDMFVACILHHS